MTAALPAVLSRGRVPARPPVHLGELLALGLTRHPVWTTALSLLLAGAGMLTAVTAAVLTLVLPFGLLLGWC